MMGIIIGYGCLRWLLDIQLGLLPFQENTLDFWIPAFLTCLPMWFWMRPRAQLLDGSWGEENEELLYLFLMTMAIVIPTYASQCYLKTRSFDLIEVNTAAQVQAMPDEKYFKIASFLLDTNHIISDTHSKVLGETEDQIRYKEYFLCPFKGTTSLWYYFSYQEIIGNTLYGQEEKAYHQRFLAASKKAFGRSIRSPITYFERLDNTDDHSYYTTVLDLHHPNLDISHLIVLRPQTSPFKARTGAYFFWTWASALVGALLIWIMVIYTPLNRAAWVSFGKEPMRRNPSLKKVLQPIDPRGSYKATAFLFWASILFFAVALFLGAGNYVPNSSQWLSWGTLSGEAVLKKGEYWRVFTALFVAGSFGFLLFNLLILVITGMFLEPLLGSAKTLWSYFLLGIIANAASVYWYRLDLWAPAGSVGLVGWCGLLFFFSAIRTYGSRHRTFLWNFLISYGLLLFFIDIVGGFNTAAHIFSFLGGFELGLLLHLIQGKQLSERAQQL